MRFGLQFPDPYDFVVDLAKRTRGVELDPIEKALVLRNEYLAKFSISNPESGDPWDTIRMYPKENNIRQRAYEHMAKRMISNEVYKYTGLNYSQFKQLPRWEAELILKVIQENRELASAPPEPPLI